MNLHHDGRQGDKTLQFFPLPCYIHDKDISQQGGLHTMHAHHSAISPTGKLK